MPTAIYRFANAQICPQLSLSSFKRRVFAEGQRKWRAAKRPPLDATRAQKKLEWYLARRDWTVKDWSKVAFSDECSVQQGSGMEQVWVLRPPEDKWKSYAITPATPNGRISVMVWAAFSGERRSDLIILEEDSSSAKGGITGRIYLDLLQTQLPTLLDKDSIFMHDNAPIHTFGQVTQWLKNMGIKVLDWPPYSPDLNPIEHQWFPLKNGMHLVDEGRLLQAKGPGQIREILGSVLPKSWEQIPENSFQTLIDSMPRRINAVIEADGWYTKY